MWVSGEVRKRIAGSVGVREKEKGMSRSSGSGRGNRGCAGVASVREREKGVCKTCECQGE